MLWQWSAGHKIHSKWSERLVQFDISLIPFEIWTSEKGDGLVKYAANCSCWPVTDKFLVQSEYSLEDGTFMIILVFSFNSGPLGHKFVITPRDQLKFTQSG